MTMIKPSPVKHGGVRKPMPAVERHVLAAEAWRAPAIVAACLVLGVVFAVLGAAILGDTRLLGADFAFWAWVFGASGCARILAFASERDGGRLALLRLGCGFVGFTAWSQLSWLSLRYTAQTSGRTADGITLCAAVALVELHAIYRAARDARSDNS